MRPNRLKALWREGNPVSVGWLMTADLYIAETMANAGFDALVLDMQHGMGIGVDRAVACLQAISTTDTVPIVRVPWNEPAYIQYVLDAGAYGVIVPLVNSPEDALKAAGASRYAPLGYRSVGPNRARLYAGSDYFQYANDEVICLVMIESIEAVGQVEAIATTPGIDGFYIGPADLAVTMGLPPGMDNKDPRHIEACQRVLDAAKAKGLVAGIHCGGVAEAVSRFEQGFKFCPIATDISLVTSGAARAIKTVREARS